MILELECRIHDAMHIIGTTYAAWAAGDIAWYIGSGRASTEFCRALRKADQTKLLMYVSSDKRGHSTEEAIANTKIYLRKYCGYKEVVEQ